MGDCHHIITRRNVVPGSIQNGSGDLGRLIGVFDQHTNQFLWGGIGKQQQIAVGKTIPIWLICQGTIRHRYIGRQRNHHTATLLQGRPIAGNIKNRQRCPRSGRWLSTHHVQAVFVATDYELRDPAGHTGVVLNQVGGVLHINHIDHVHTTYIGIAITKHDTGGRTNGLG